MSEDKRYNGWTNYETWNAALWMDNDESSHEYWNERTAEACNDSADDDEAIRTLADEMKDEHEENAPDLGASFYADMLGAALSEVNWYEIAENRVTDYRAENPREADEDADAPECAHSFVPTNNEAPYGTADRCRFCGEPAGAETEQ